MTTLKPEIDETREKFMSRFMSDGDMRAKFPGNNERLAVARKQWEEGPDGIKELPVSPDGEIKKKNPSIRGKGKATRRKSTRVPAKRSLD